MPDVERYNSAALIKYCWDQVAEVFWERYPNPYSNHVSSEDVILRHVENGVLHTRRVLCKRKNLPRVLRMMSGRSHMSTYVVEDSVIDRNERIIWTYTYNVQLRHFSVFAESNLYYEMVSAHNNVGNRTGRVVVCDKHALSSSKYGGYIVHSLMSRYRKTEQESSLGLQYILDKRFLPASVNEQRGISDIAKWRSDSIVVGYLHSEQSVASGSNRLLQWANKYFTRYAQAMYSRLRLLKSSIQLNTVSP